MLIYQYFSFLNNAFYNSRGGFPQTSEADLDQAWVKKGNFDTTSDRGFGGGREKDIGFGRNRDGYGRDGFNRDNDRGGFSRENGDRGFNRDGGGFGRDRRGDEENLSWSRNDAPREHGYYDDYYNDN